MRNRFQNTGGKNGGVRKHSDDNTRPEGLCMGKNSMVSDTRRILTQIEPSVSESFWILPFLESLESGNAVATRNSDNGSRFHLRFLHPLDVPGLGI